MGGVITDTTGKTGVRGLFAVGEVMAGAHGANRLGGNALAEIFTMGAVVGEAAGIDATASAASAPVGAMVEAEHRHSKRRSGHGTSYRRCESGLNQQHGLETVLCLST
jgi:succinate dehydrogenase/fumarate reductase flavoprotein subunit